MSRDPLAGAVAACCVPDPSAARPRVSMPERLENALADVLHEQFELGMLAGKRGRERITSRDTVKAAQALTAFVRVYGVESGRWPHDATDRVHELMRQLGEKGLEIARLAELLRDKPSALPQGRP